MMSYDDIHSHLMVLFANAIGTGWNVDRRTDGFGLNVGLGGRPAPHRPDDRALTRGSDLYS